MFFCVFYISVCAGYTTNFVKRSKGRVTGGHDLFFSPNLPTSESCLLGLSCCISVVVFLLLFFVNCGADQNFMGAHQLQLQLEPLPCHLIANALDIRFLCRLLYQTKPLDLHMSSNHSETIGFHIISSLQLPLTLGYPWLIKHNPHTD